MSNDNKRSGNNDKGNPNNWLWYLLVGSMLVLLVGTFIFNQAIKRLSYPDLIQLIQDTEYVKRGSKELANGSTSRIEVSHSTSSKERLDEYSKPHSIRIDASYVSGKAYYRQLNANHEPMNELKLVDFGAPRDDGDETYNELKNVLEKANVDWDITEGPGVIAQYAPLMLPVLILLAVLFFMLRKLGGAGSPMSFARSRGKLYAQEDIGVTFNEVAGIDEAVEEVREIVDFLRFPDKYQKLGGRIPKGVLLVGPPGTGKTLLAKAIAGEASVPFFSISGSDFVEMFVGVGAARVRDMFQQAQAKSPCIIFIDELDALGKSRAGNVPGSHDEREQTLNALLVEMDGFDANAGIIIVAATNRPETLDPALLRPGRFDRNVLVDRPDKQGRVDILKVHVKSVKLDVNVDINQIASITPGFGGAELANLVNEAALLAARRAKSTVGQQEFNDGVERVTAGLEKKNRVMNEEEKRRVAYHEAGHALVAYSLPDTDPVHKVSIIPRGFAALGYTMQRPTGDRYLMTQLELEAQMQVLLAGTLTEELVFRDISTGAQNDLERSTAIARSMVMEYGMSRLGRVNYRESNRSPFLMSNGGGDAYGHGYSEQTAREIDEEVNRIVNETVEKTRAILSERRTALEALTKRLIEIESVDSEELRNIIEGSLSGPRVVPGTAASPRRSDESTEIPNDQQSSSPDATRAPAG